jgi:hypothetical protein
MKRKNKGLEELLRAALGACEVGRRDTRQRQDGGAECLVLGDSIIRNVKAKHMSVQYFPGVTIQQLKRVAEPRYRRN